MQVVWEPHKEVLDEFQELVETWHEQATELEDNPEDDLDNEKAETLRHCASIVQRVILNRRG